MNSPIKTLSALVIGGFLAGSAFAGPGDAYGAGFASRAVVNTKPVGIALFKGGVGLANTANCPMIKEQSKWIPTGNPKSPGVTKVVTGYKHEGCVSTSAGTIACKGSTESCSTMLHGS